MQLTVGENLPEPGNCEQEFNRNVFLNLTIVDMQTKGGMFAGTWQLWTPKF